MAGLAAGYKEAYMGSSCSKTGRQAGRQAVRAIKNRPQTHARAWKLTAWLGEEEEARARKRQRREERRQRRKNLRRNETLARYIEDNAASCAQTQRGQRAARGYNMGARKMIHATARLNVILHLKGFT